MRLAGLSAREQLEAFRNAEIVVGPQGAGLGWLLFSERIPAVVLYPNGIPNTFFLTQIRALRQEHVFLLHGAPDEDDDFDADVARLRAIVERAVTPTISA